MRWYLALCGLFMLVFSLCALAGPGRIDIADGQTRYAVACSLLEHGDSIVRDNSAWMDVFIGRNGEHYAWYRLPQSLLGIPAILAADATAAPEVRSTPDRREMRRQFFFSLTSPFCGAVLAVCYAVWFRQLGCPVRASMLWAFAGIVCTPSWYYSTSSFDDILGTAGVVLAVTAACLGRDRAPLAGAAVAGLALAWSFNCKEPLGIFVLPVLAAFYRPNSCGIRRSAPLAIVILLLAGGCAAHFAYEWYKFPPGTTNPSEQFTRLYGPIWTANPLPALAGLTVSASAGVFFYCPTMYLAIRGWWACMRSSEWMPLKDSAPLFCKLLALACGVFTLFFCFLTFFKGDPAWGPRYLTPVFAVGWLFVPAAVSRVRDFVFRAVLSLGVIVQLLGLSVDPIRLFFSTPIHFGYYHENPWLGFNPQLSHLMQRPREITECLQMRDSQLEFSPAPLPTAADNLNFSQAIFFAQIIGYSMDPAGREPLHLLTHNQASVQLSMPETYKLIARNYRVFNSLRPWWISQRTLPAQRRPVNHTAALCFFIGLGLVGVLMIRLYRKEPASFAYLAPATPPGSGP